jgi:hypothetical protein
MMKHSFFPTCLMLFFLTSCAQRPLVVETQYLSHRNLASYHVRTPDPLLNNPPIGQRLLVSWSLPKESLALTDLHLEINLRFRNRESAREIVSIDRLKGTYLYTVVNESYFKTQGILSYDILLIGGGCIIDEWRHQLWGELITIGDE